MTTYPLATLACTIDSTGISAPTYADVLASLKASFQLIYGSDAYLEPDSQDGQMLAVFARAIHDCNAQTIATYNAFSPASAQGAGLSSVVKINGLRRNVATNSTVDVTITGTAGTVIVGGLVGDSFANAWVLPDSVVIPVGGSIVVTATAQDVGALAAAPGTITRILTPTRGWQSVTNAASATLGAPVETDADLRRRQSVSTAIPADSVLGGIVAAVANLEGVQRYRAYENDTGSIDADGIPGHSISLVVEGGDATEIAEAIATKKTPGTGTYGSTTETVIDDAGVPVTINFYRPTDVALEVEIDLTALAGYVSTTGEAVVAAVVAYANGLAIGDDVYLTKFIAATNLADAALAGTYNITAVRICRLGGTPTAADEEILFNEAASLDEANVTLTVT